MQKKTRLRKFIPRDRQNYLKRLRTHVRAYGHSNVSWADDPELAGWIKSMCQQLHKFTIKQLDELIDVGFFSAEST